MINNKRGFTLIETMISIVIVTIITLSYVKFTETISNDKKSKGENAELRMVVVDALEKEREIYKVKDKEVDDEKSETISYHYNGREYSVEITAKEMKNIVNWKERKSKLIKITAIGKHGIKKMEVNTYVTQGK